MAEPIIRTLYAGRHELGEGPSYDPDTDSVWWFNITACELYEHRFGSGETIRHELPRMGSVIARVDEANQLIATEHGLYLRDRATGALRLHLPLEAENAVTRSNDGRTHPSGALWIGTMGKQAEKGAGAIYWVRGSEMRKLYDKVTIPNAICFSPDGKTGYWTDTATGVLNRVDVDPQTGMPNSEPQVFHDNRSDKGGLDGAVVDRNGMLWNARWGAGCVDMYNPDGKRIRSISLPARQTSCPAFCGSDGQQLLVTSATQDMDAKALQRDPQAGDTFLVEGGFEGLFDPPFALNV